LGEQLAQAAWDVLLRPDQKLNSSINIYLSGDLGAGKTTLVRGFLRGLGFQGKVKSPSYSLVESYLFDDQSVYHFDFYRIHHPGELEFIGLQEYFDQAAICLVEWPEQALSLLPPADIFLRIEVQEHQRRMEFEATSQVGNMILEQLKHVHRLD
jgi:tRNA threonylcarbamoyladenosine biosynthesis protein TsaE